ncbi:MAG: response regulator [Ferruginibacter sp.]
MQRTKTVFLVDDDIDDQEIFSTALGRADRSVNCVFSSDGIDALEKIKNELGFIPDLIFIDLNMPRMNGKECLINIKKIERLKDVPVYMYSTSADTASIAANMELGAVDFIVKPSNIHDLTAILKKILQNQLFLLCLFIVFFATVPAGIFAQKSLPAVAALKRLSVEELMNIEVTSVSKSPQKLTEVASAIQVLTDEDIRRSATTTLPEILRLAANLQVARAGSHDWSVTSRGFNGAPIANSSLADKLLVMIDGRTVYNPLFGGVYWDAQAALKENIDRIEVVSGPGGTLWGANAVNGVINVITKNAKETQGLSIGASYGSYLRDGFSIRYGSHIDSTFFFRIFGQRWDYNSSKYTDGTYANDDWSFNRGGFRMDYMPSAKNQFILQGDLYGGDEDKNDSTQINGQNVMARWTHVFSERSNLSVQTYYDRTWRNIKPSHLTDEINTFDIDLQHSFKILRRNRLTWGAGYRVLKDATVSLANTFTPPTRTLELFNGFIQDQVTLMPKRLELTIGTKLLHNDYTGFEWQPSGRLAWTPTEEHTIWAAVSRAVRTPSRFDADITSFTLVNHPAFKSEEVLAYELGYRVHPNDKINVSLATFYNRYEHLRSFDTTGNPAAAVVFGNNLRAKSWGFEISGNYFITNWWRIRTGYTYLNKEFKLTAGNTLPGTKSIEAVDPVNQAMLQSIMDLPKNIEFDLLGRYIGKIPKDVYTNEIPAYFSLDLRVNWTYRFLSLGISVQNLTDDSHLEFGNREIPRSIHGRIGLRF